MKPPRKHPGIENLKKDHQVRVESEHNIEHIAKAIPGDWVHNRDVIRAFLLHVRATLCQGQDAVMLPQFGNMRLRFYQRRSGPAWGIKFKPASEFTKQLQGLVGKKKVERRHITHTMANKIKFKDVARVPDGEGDRRGADPAGGAAGQDVGSVDTGAPGEA